MTVSSQTSRRSAGFTLVEIAIGLFIGIVVVLGTLQAVATAARAHRALRESFEATMERWNQSRALREEGERNPWDPAAALVEWGETPSLVIIDPHREDFRKPALRPRASTPADPDSGPAKVVGASGTAEAR